MSSERQEINPNNPWWGEHIHRYNEVINRLNGNEFVLDIACGTGYGTFLLSQNTTSNVIGGDLSKDAIKLCHENWSNPNLSYSVMDGVNLPFDDSFFDVLVSFETIEHTKKYNKMITEFKRVLKPEGFILLSTPNRVINSPSGIVTNPYHSQEWNYNEFITILKHHFNKIELLGQKYNRYADGNLLSKYIENILYKRGIRKIPLKYKNKVMKLLGYQSFYPLPTDYLLTENMEDIKNCKTFFAICQK